MLSYYKVIALVVNKNQNSGVIAFKNYEGGQK